ncbi:MAG: hypothetical protein K2W99_04925 [Chthoniobacterales bacterium]|nr:hypothetical protein [Chthoniobacterales bacterium]
MNKLRLRSFQLFLALLVITSLYFVFNYISCYGVNIPVNDDWDLLQTILNWQKHGLDLASLVAFHNEHRIIVSRVIIGSLLALTGGNFKAVLFFNAFIPVLTLYLLLQFLTSYLSKINIFCLVSIPIAILITGRFQWQNWLWAFQLPWFVLPLITVLTIRVLFSKLQLKLTLILTVILLIIANCCMANGIVCWLAVLPALFVRLQSVNIRTKFSIYFSWLFMVCFALFYVVINTKKNIASLSLEVTQLIEYVEFFLAVIGSPFTAAQTLLGVVSASGIVIGIISCLVTLAVLIILWRKEALFTPISCMGLGLLIYSVGSALLITFGRYQMTSCYQIESRYTTPALYFQVGFIVLVSIITGIVNRKRWLHFVSFFVLIIFFCIISFLVVRENKIFCIHGGNLQLAHSYHHALLRLSQAPLLKDKLDVVAHNLQGNNLFHIIAQLEKYNLLKCSRFCSDDVLVDSVACNFQVNGNLDVIKKEDNGMISLEGWTTLGKSHHPADATVLLAPNGNVTWELVAISTAERTARPDVVTALHSPDAMSSGWIIKLPETVVKPDLQLAIYDAEANEFICLPMKKDILAITPLAIPN